MTDLPAYSGPGGQCPKCRAGGVLTEWHHTGGPDTPTKKIPRLQAPCRRRNDLDKPGREGEHLCRLCANCGYGWVEACAASDDATRLRLVPDREGTGQCPG